ncbi:MAG: phage baseplate assembly protein V [Candidatus Sulfotelmatobacter sp.]
MTAAAPPSTNSTPQRFYGKFRGLVVDNLDPMQMGRIVAQVPDALGETPSSWAMPCVPAAGIQAGCFFVPPIGSQVWMEFEQGNPDYPIWSGGFWGQASDIPMLALAPPPVVPSAGQNIVLQTSGQNTLVISDAAPTPATGGIILQSSAGATLIVNDSGIYLSAGPGMATISLTGSLVAINDTALTISGP